MNIDDAQFALRLTAFSLNVVAIIVDIQIICQRVNRHHGVNWNTQNTLCLMAGFTALIHSSFMFVGKLCMYLGREVMELAIMWDIAFYATLAITCLAYLDRFQRLQLQTPLTPSSTAKKRWIIMAVCALNIMLALAAVAVGIVNTLCDQRYNGPNVAIMSLYIVLGICSDFYLNFRLISVTLENSEATSQIESEAAAANAADAAQQQQPPLPHHHHLNSSNYHQSSYSSLSIPAVATMVPISSGMPSISAATTPSPAISMIQYKNQMRRKRRVYTLRRTMLSYFIALMVAYLFLMIMSTLARTISNLHKYDHEFGHLAGVFTSFHCWISFKLLGIFLVELKKLNKKPPPTSTAALEQVQQLGGGGGGGEVDRRGNIIAAAAADVVLVDGGGGGVKNVKFGAQQLHHNHQHLLFRHPQYQQHYLSSSNRSTILSSTRNKKKSDFELPPDAHHSSVGRFSTKTTTTPSRPGVGLIGADLALSCVTGRRGRGASGGSDVLFKFPTTAAGGGGGDGGTPLVLIPPPEDYSRSDVEEECEEEQRHRHQEQHPQHQQHHVYPGLTTNLDHNNTYASSLASSSFPASSYNLSSGDGLGNDVSTRNNNLHSNHHRNLSTSSSQTTTQPHVLNAYTEGLNNWH